MSRRESRTSLDARQNDALFEFENFKKKFLLANKHITKLNSTLSVRIEEQNARISFLETENLRLLAEKNTVALELKRERAKSRRIIEEAESLLFGFTNRLKHLRQDFRISATASPTPSPPIPRATQRPSPNTDSSPISPRLVREPTIPRIHEDDEPTPSSDDESQSHPQSRTKNRRLSSSRLPLPTRMSSPTPEVDLVTVGKRKPTRRHSGLLTIDTRLLQGDSTSAVRPSSPAFGSPDRREAGLAEEEEIAALRGDDVKTELSEESDLGIKKEKRKVKSKGKERDTDSSNVSVRKKLRDEANGLIVDGKKLKLKDVTNSPRSRAAPSPIDAAVISEVELAPTEKPRQFLSGSPPQSAYLPTPQASSSPPLLPATTPEPEPEPESAFSTTRERRVRKSVNYAEPKLNTKMRKPDPEPGTSTAAPRKRASAAAVMSTQNHRNNVQDPDRRREREKDTDEDTDTDRRSSVERELSADPSRVPLPSSRPPSSTSSMPRDSFPPSSSSTGSSSSSSSSKRKKSQAKSYREVQDDDSDGYDDGADADAEWVPSGKGGYGSSSSSSTWANVNVGERRSRGKRPGNVEEDASRRHSMAV
ncbi:hypothetical protein K435DRAFT_825720 [Dendrothele bispora CBS 962.96]|uniref:Shugoshin C-terminal domain-containing protein n=1 Tax=Dendrothele bispora (strain CBS 962.96) TaxID=1314807 RepID=A0A4S8MUG1_DENBC|nr:hypothetical protein K435DRAFT_825720 [Dendrothele bispora CBS 962.96]